jgi:hypothetical protein
MDELFDMQRVYHRAIFDCFSEGLLATLLSSPMTLSENLFKKVPKEDSPDWLEKSKEWVLDCATILAGIIRDKEDSMMGNIRFMDAEFVQQLREDRMYRMITLAVDRLYQEHRTREGVGIEV